MTEFMNSIMPALMQLVIAIVTCIFGYAGIKLKQLYNVKIDTAEKKDVAWHTVQYVEQICKDLKGPEKFDMCLDEIAKVLSEKNIPFGKEEMKVLIESAVKSMNDSMKG